MEDGFKHLETGNFQKAETFFEGILEKYPTNKTARLCYGRAIGLNGNPEKANQLFTDLLHDYSQDIEVKLNFGESLLWLKKFETAKQFYTNLINEVPQSFPALLGYANTLSNLKDYENALTYVNKALAVSPGNENALVSKKYIYLGFAYQKQQSQNYDDAELLLIENLKLFKNDKETLLNLANLYLITNKINDAEATYHILKDIELHKIDALNGLSLVEHLKGKEKNALTISSEAYNSITTSIDTLLAQRTEERYAQALIWNKKYTQADNVITQLIKKQPNATWTLALRATLNIYKSNFKKSLADYNLILEKDSTSFDGNLGKANTLKALGRYDDAYLAAEKTLEFYPNQKDATQFIKELDALFTPQINTQVSYSFDNGDNRAFSFTNSIQFPISTKFKLLGNYSYRTTNNTVTKTKANSNDVSFGASYQFAPNATLKGTVGVTSAKAETTDYTQLLADVSIHLKPFKLQALDFGYKREIQNFNADLLNREIVQNNFYFNYNLNTNFNLGWFSQYYYTSQNDSNSRQLLFTSLYYNILAKPSLKVGVNYQYITFKNQVPTIYFSPERFNAGEIFLNLIKDETITKAKHWFYELTAATGLQSIENNKNQSTVRFQGKLGYKFSQRCIANFYGIHSNIASTTATGFRYTEVGFRLKWLLHKKPVFRK